MFQNIFDFSNILGGINDIVEHVQSTVQQIQSIFSDIDFTILYNWLPSDIATVITATIAILLLLALYGLLRRLLFFLG